MINLSYRKLRTQIAVIIIIMLAAIVVLSIFSFRAFSEIIRSRNAASFTQNFQSYLNYTENQYKVLDTQMSWISGSVDLSGYFDNESLWDRSVANNQIRNNLNGVITTFNSVEAAVILFSDSHVMIESHRLPEKRFLEAMKVIRDPGNINWQAPRTISMGTDPSAVHLILSQSIYSYNKYGRKQSIAGRIYFFVNPEEILPSGDPFQVQNALLLNRENESAPVLLTNLKNDIRLDPSVLTVTTDTGPISLVIDGKTYQYFYQQVDQSDLFLLSVIPSGRMSAGNKRAIFSGMGLLFLVTVFAIFSIWFLTSEISIPLRRIEDGMNRISEGDFEYRLQEKGNSELTLISNGVNQLLDHLQSANHDVVKAQERLYESELLQRDSRIRVLQFQINPHFLYNTLECIRSIAQNYQIRELTDIVGALIGIFRYNTSGESIITLREELVCSKYYAKIIEIRFSGKYTFEFQYDESILENGILKMTLQPILENAVLHGLAERPGPGRVLISCQKDQGNILISIEDDGIGISEDSLAELVDKLNSPYDINSGDTIGLRNVHQRLRYEYGENNGLKIESVLGSYTRVSFRIPAEPREMKHKNGETL